MARPMLASSGLSADARARPNMWPARSSPTQAVRCPPVQVRRSRNAVHTTIGLGRTAHRWPRGAGQRQAVPRPRRLPGDTRRRRGANDGQALQRGTLLGLRQVARHAPRHSDNAERGHPRPAAAGPVPSRLMPCRCLSSASLKRDGMHRDCRTAVAPGGSHPGAAAGDRPGAAGTRVQHVVHSKNRSRGREMSFLADRGGGVLGWLL